MRRVIPILICCAAMLMNSACVKRFESRYPALRWLVDRDQQPIVKPKARQESLYWDGAENQFFHQIERLVQIPDRASDLLHIGNLGTSVEALNTNNFDEVADSTWFTNRLGRRSVSQKEAYRGPNRNKGPDVAGKWTILSAKTVGQTPGFLIKDSRGDLYLIKFDPPGFPELASGAEIVSTRLFYIFGYNVPENYIAYFQPKRLRISSKSTTKDEFGNKIPFRQKDLEAVLINVDKRADGTIRVLASKFLSGEPLGPIPFRGLRPDDKNDRILHEHRRELRGYRILAAFLDHSDSREANSLDMFEKTTTDGRGIVRHYLIDFGNTLGSYGIGPKERGHLYDYFLNYGRVLGSTLALGFYRPYWLRARTLDNAAVGQFESNIFVPHKWKPVYPNPAFQNMTDRDAFWATKILVHLSDGMIRAAINAAEYSDQRVSDYIYKILIERRNKILAHWLVKMCPLTDFKIAHKSQRATIAFVDLAVKSGLHSSSLAQYRFRRRDPRNNQPVTQWQSMRATKINIPFNKRSIIEIRKKITSQKDWSPPIDLLVDGEKRPSLLALRRYY